MKNKRPLIFGLILWLGLMSGINTAKAFDAFSAILTGLQVVDVVMNDFVMRSRYNNEPQDILQNLAYTTAVDSVFISDLHRQGYNDGEIYYILAMHEYSRLPIHRIVEEQHRGIGWGVLAHELGIHPGAFNKARVQLKKDRPVVVTKDRLFIVSDDGDSHPSSGGKGNSKVKKEKDHGPGNSGGHGKGKGK